jgi:hypothetical protein
VSTGTVILLVLVLLVIAVAAGLASTLAHRQAAQRRRVGAEFSRLVREAGPRRARAEFAARRRRVESLGIKPLSDERRTRFQRLWAVAQDRFIDSPPQAATAAARLVTAVAAERGYDVSDSGQLLVDLSVYHGQYLDGYRRATRTTEQAAAATEELRQAMLDHRALFQDLLEAPAAPDTGAPGTGAATAGRPATRALRLPWQQVRPTPRRGARRRDQDGIAATRSSAATDNAIREDTRR